MSNANALKDLGNKAFTAKDYDKAIDLFSQAITLDPNNHVLFSNRSAAKAGKKDWTGALADADECVKINPTWGKGWARKGAALHGARNYEEAIKAFEKGIEVEDSPALRKGLQEVKDAQAADAPFTSPFGNLFSDPGLMAKLMANPTTAKYLADPSFVQKLQMIQKHPTLAQSALQDPRFIEVMGVAMGIDIHASTRPEGSNDLPPDLEPVSSPTPSSLKSPHAPPQPTPAAVAEEDIEMGGGDEEEAKARKDADAAKKAGGEAYKQRKFEEATGLYQKAWDLWPKDVTFLTNLGAAYFENGDYDKAIEACEKAIDEGRSLRADYKLLAKAYGRIGSAWLKKEDLNMAIKYFNKSLTEHRTPDVLAKLRETEKQKADEERCAYIDPTKSEAAREEGNAQFKSGDFASAVKSYTESIKRNPSDARGYNNRAAAYMKLAALPEALKDVNEAIKTDPNLAKAYIRKSTILFSMRDYTKALEAIQEASEHDPEHKHTSEIAQQEVKIQQALFTQRGEETQEETLARAMRDPEVAQIMNDPVMQQILQQAQSDPKALQDHMKNPTVRSNIQKLVNAGIIRAR